MNIVTPEEAGFSSERLQRVNSLMQGYVDSGRLAGVVTLLAREGEVFHFERFGYQDLASQKPMELDMIFRFYSMTKPITSVAVMMLYEAGHFHLDDPVSTFIPELDGLKVFDGMGQTGAKLVPQQIPITIRQLLTHTAGLSYGHYEDEQMDQTYHDDTLNDPDISLKEMVEKLSHLPLIGQPGTAWRYSFATDVLGRLVEMISGESFDSFLKDRIFDPLGMDDTAFYVAEDKLDRLSAIYGPSENGGIQELDNPGVNKYKRPLTNFSGGGGLTSTAADYLKFCQMMLDGGSSNGGRILAPKTIEMMTSNHLPDDLLQGEVKESGVDYSQGCGFGLGFRVILDIAEHGIIGSDGSYSWGGAASTVFWIDPIEDLIAIMLTQFMPSSQYPIRREFQVATYQAMVE
jgi:CubicO group peptidase (beta-lactamase class C family)